MYKINPIEIARAKENFALRGESISEWARKNSFNLQMVYKILNGKSKAIRGQGHIIAVKLGIKPQPKDENS